MPLDRWSKPTNTRDDAVIHTLSSGNISIMVSRHLSGSPLAR